MSFHKKLLIGTVAKYVRRIQKETKTSDPHFTVDLKGQNTYQNTQGFDPKKPFFRAGIIAALFIFPIAFAHAGFLSFLGDMFDRTTVVFQKKEATSQNMALLQAAVHADPSTSKGGGGVTVVDGVALASGIGTSDTTGQLDGTEGPKSDQISVYVVRPGDSLSQIGEMFGVSARTIMWANDIDSRGLIQPGQTLVILPVSGIQHEVNKGDTLAGLAKKYDADIQEILEFNGFEEGHTLAVGDEVIIPGGEMQIEPPKATYVASVSKNTPNYQGYYMRPVNGGRKTQGVHGYNAVDIAAPVGTPILAAADGEVILSKYAAGNPWFGGYGNYIVVKHPNGTQTVYAHLSQNLVKRGWKVVKGQVIGYMGSTGRSTGSHLHFEIRGAVNPF